MVWGSDLAVWVAFSSCCWSSVVRLDVLEQVLRATLCADSIRFVTNILYSLNLNLLFCRLFTQVLQSSSVSGTFVLQFIRNTRACMWAGVSTSRVSSSSCIMPWEGSERACVNFNWSEALIGQTRVACLSTFSACFFLSLGIRRFRMSVGMMARSGTWSLR